ncbi:hypothetical protein [Streptomyces sp. NBC_00344]|uniref:hypothetical protein n=1 Tax=Streptomyces sp. NBC_00344 TaxID=2975720 RepID=UPI002E1B4391
MRNILRTAAVAGAGALLTFATATSAFAESTWFVYSANKAGFGEFTDNGDKFVACDHAADGYGVYLKMTGQVYRGPATGNVGVSAATYFSIGNGNCSSNWVPYDLAEKTPVTLQVCLGKSINGFVEVSGCGAVTKMTA